MKDIVKKLLKKYKWLVVIEVLFIIINVYLIAIPSRIVGNLINYLYDIDGNKDLIIQSIIKLLVVCIGFMITRVIWKSIEVKLEFATTKDLKDEMFSKMLKSKIESLEEIKNGKIMSFFVSDTQRVSRISSRMISAVSRIILNFIIVGYLMFKSSNVMLTIVALIPILITVILIILLRNKVSDSYKKALQNYRNMFKKVLIVLELQRPLLEKILR